MRFADPLVVVLMGLIHGALACSPTPKARGPVAGAEPAVVSPPAADTESVPAEVLWIDDDIPAARARATERGHLLLVDAWAPWCHTCLAMRTGALADPRFAALQDRVTFAAIDTDRPDNAEFVAAHTMRFWPTFFAIEPKEGIVLGVWTGAASADELLTFLMQALARLETADADVLSLAARLETEGEDAAATEAFERALGEHAPGGTPFAQAALGRIRTLYALEEPTECAERGLAVAPQVVGAAVAADLLYYVRRCGLDTSDQELRARSLAYVRERLEALTEAPPEGASDDDVADAMAQLAATLDALGEPEAARAIDARRVRLMEEAAARASSPEAAMVYDYQRAGAYLALGRGEDAIAMLDEREAQLPDSYEPPGRLAWVYAELGRHDEAIAAADRAIARSYGPRRLSYLRRKAEALGQVGRKADQRAVMERELAGHYELHPGLQKQERIEELERMIAALPEAP